MSINIEIAVSYYDREGTEHKLRADTSSFEVAEQKLDQLKRAVLLAAREEAVDLPY